jgi:hypothetical protein
MAVFREIFICELCQSLCVIAQLMRGFCPLLEFGCKSFSASHSLKVACANLSV